MNQNKDHRLDFSVGRHLEMLVWQRQQMWTQEAVERIARWLGLTPGMIIVDVGCGLGYLGYTYWKYFGSGGQYIGVDMRPALLADAQEAAERWATEGVADFVVGDAYNIPLPDNVADGVMCQTLMFHLDQPKLALAEMIRVVKPGGLILCKEPDNLRVVLAGAHSSLPELGLERRLLGYKVNFIINQGRIKLGRGDRGVAPKIPHMLHELGIDDIDVRVKDTVPFVEPPYPTADQQQHLENLKKHWLNEESYRARVEEQRKEFLAGGGDLREFDELVKVGEQQRLVQLRQIENGEFFVCGAYPFYLIKGRKPG